MINVYAPMLVGKAPKNYLDKFKNEKILGSLKKDGYWSQLIKDNNTVHLYSRNISRKTKYYNDNIDKVPHIKEWAMENLPNGTTIIGEVFYPNGTSKNVTSVLGALPQKAIERQNGEYGKLHFYMHDLLAYDGADYVMNDVTYSHRYSHLCRHIDICTPLIPEVEVAPCYDNVYCDLSKCVENAIRDGEEGMVFRTEEGLYAPGKRQPQTMFKIKQGVDNVDLVISGFVKPEYHYNGKNPDGWPYKNENGEPITKAACNGWVEGFYVGCYDSGKFLPVGKVTSGLTDEIKADAGKNPRNYFRKVCELSCMSLDKENYTLRHPVFVRMRPDKGATECRLEEIFV